MATQEDVRRIALSPSRTSVAAGANPEVLAVRVASLAETEELLAASPEKFFSEPHYNGFPAVLVRLPIIDAGEVAELITDAWRCQAPRALSAELGGSPQ
jgi:hypothetical protein